MTAPTFTPAQIVAMLDVDPAAGILGAADLREQRANAATGERWVLDPFEHYEEDDPTDNYWDVDGAQSGGWIAHVGEREDAEHIAAEANPTFALAAVRRWRGVVERHRMVPVQSIECTEMACAACYSSECPDLAETADEARAYLGGTS